MTFNELYAAITKILPDAIIDEDMQGQLVIYTNLCERDDELVDIDFYIENPQVRAQP